MQRCNRFRSGQVLKMDLARPPPLRRAGQSRSIGVEVVAGGPSASAITKRSPQRV